MAKKNEAKQDIKDLNKELGYIEDQIISIADSLSRTVKDAISDIKDEASSVGDIFEKKLSKSIKSLANDSETILANTLKLYEGSAKLSNIQKSQERLKLKELALTRNLDILQNNGLLTATEREDKEREITDAIKRQNTLLKGQAELAQQIKSKMGVTGKVIESFTKIPLLGNLIDSERVLAKVQAEAASKNATKTSVFKTGLKETGKVMKENLLDPAVLFGGAFTILVKLAKMFIGAMFEADEQVTNLGKSLNISKDTAREVRDRFSEISKKAQIYANIEKNQLVLRKELIEAQLQLNNLLGNAIDYSEQLGERGIRLVSQFAAITKFLKLSGEEQQGLVNLSAITGKELNDIEYSILGTVKLYKIQNKFQVDEAKIFKDILRTSNYIKLSIKGGTDALIQATINASKLGITLDQLSNTQSSLLNFEESISSELEAELLTGRDLNLERARYAALTNDQVALTEEINRLVADGAIDFEHNFFAAEAMAKTLGISTKELADMATAQKASLKLSQAQYNLSEDDKNLLKDKAKLTDNQLKLLSAGKLSGVEFYDALKKAGIGIKSIVDNLGEEAARNLQAQSAQEKFNDSLERAKEVFTSFVDGGFLDKLSDAIIKFSDLVIGVSGREENVAKSYSSIKSSGAYEKYTSEQKQQIEEINKVASNQVGFWSKLTAKLMGNPIASAVLEAQDVTSRQAAQQLNQIKAKGFEASTNQTINAKDYVIKTLPQDTVVAAGGTNLGRTDEIVSLLSQILHKEGYVAINSSKFGTGYSLGTFKVQ